MTPPPVEAATLERVLPEVGVAPQLELTPDARRLRRLRRLRRWRRWPLSAALRRDLAAVWRPFVGSRLLVFGVGALTMLVAGVGASEWTMDPLDVTTSFGRVGNLLAAPVVRWDSLYYLQIAQHGYQHPQDAAFFPLYPLLIRALAVVTGSFVIAGLLISLSSMLATLVIVRRLTALDFGERAADLAVRLLAFGPMAVFLSAVYTESLFLAVTSGAFYAARRGRWMIAGLLGGLAATCRSGGMLLLPVLLIMFLWGPRADALPRVNRSRWRPRYRLSAAALWLLLIPVGAEALSLYFIARGFGSAAPLRAQEVYHQHMLTLPVVGLWQGLVSGWHQVELILTGTPLTSHPTQALFQCVALVVTILALVGMFRRFPFAYSLYAALGSVVLSLSVPTLGDPLAGFARYASLRFPLFMFAAVWAIEHRRQRALLVCFGLVLILATVQFSDWQVVGTPTL